MAVPRAEAREAVPERALLARAERLAKALPAKLAELLAGAELLEVAVDVRHVVHLAAQVRQRDEQRVVCPNLHLCARPDGRAAGVRDARLRGDRRRPTAATAQAGRRRRALSSMASGSSAADSTCSLGPSASSSAESAGSEKSVRSTSISSSAKSSAAGAADARSARGRGVPSRLDCLCAWPSVRLCAAA